MWPPVARLAAPLLSGLFLLSVGLRGRRPLPPLLQGDGLPFAPHHGNFCVSAELTGAERRRAGVTLVTQGSLDHVDQLVGLVDSWDGPVSAALYVALPAQLPALLRLLRRALRCRPALADVHLRVFFRRPEGQDCQEAAQEHSYEEEDEEESCDGDCAQCLKKASGRLWRDPDYPVNVARNLALRSVFTPLQLVADIQLQPSLHFARDFVKYYEREEASLGQEERVVWVVPVFESNATETVPRTLAELRRGSQRGSVVPFHVFRAPECHRIPDLKGWWSGDGAVGRHSEQRWLRPCWEPVFVARPATPLYDERFQGYGRNKIQQLYEMCRQGYRFRVLRGLFLVHRGISVLSPPLWARIGAHVAANNRLFRAFRREMDERYGVGDEDERYCNRDVVDQDAQTFHVGRLDDLP